MIDGALELTAGQAQFVFILLFIIAAVVGADWWDD